MGSRAYRLPLQSNSQSRGDRPRPDESIPSVLAFAAFCVILKGEFATLGKKFHLPMDIFNA